MFGVPKTTIINHVSGRIELTSKPVIPLEIENAIAQKVVEAANMGFGITKKQLKLKISRSCKAQRISTPFKRGIPGDD